MGSLEPIMDCLPMAEKMLKFLGSWGQFEEFISYYMSEDFGQNDEPISIGYSFKTERALKRDAEMAEVVTRFSDFFTSFGKI